ncbi:nuclear transport factor 2 family protein [Shivajiella indica]|uniref:Nuclear transport factor 2 family protein n=1 Tax=Shivajiella indica TaxID=872115 RepID=A0ABW5BAD3_9BACT
MFDYNTRELVIRNYINAYNAFDVHGMIKDMDTNILFENISDGQVTMSLKGIEAFRQQAEQSLSYFSSRNQSIETLVHEKDQTVVELNYRAVLAMDFPNGLKKGDQIQLRGKSIFKFSKENKIIHLKDIA